MNAQGGQCGSALLVLLASTHLDAPLVTAPAPLTWLLPLLPQMRQYGGGWWRSRLRAVQTRPGSC